ncbi:GNAT family N-acetyltransferase [Mycoplasmopsis phocirhinis]|uniref:GNAT family N-acetyltransferase n=1 Tax=Mycoplasmopsis phocirhinis TaxID=142650 RepID=A0A4P6MTZ6_9BACT|nr:GNAT family N-acetyltransferase [Mycoplasmopsis phocirhinis]QBF34877.1 GNAT family N-acetyltransferase [Mycoplasmopsis phocirhinis]
MILKATQNDINSVKHFLNLDADKNFFFIGDIDSYGVESTIHKTLIKVEQDEIVAVLLIFNQTLLFFDPYSKLCWSEINEIILQNNLKNINISDDMFKKIEKYVKNENKYVIHQQIMAKLNHKININTDEVSKAELKDIPKIVESRLKIKEFANFANEYDHELKVYTQSFTAGISNPFIIKNENNDVISCALIAINADNKCFIGGVYTLNQYRKQGLASKVVAKLSNWIIEQQKIPMLFYHNPEAGSVYRSLGYEEIGSLYTIIVK